MNIFKKNYTNCWIFKILPKDTVGMMLFGFKLFRDRQVSARMVTHESIHQSQYLQFIIVLVIVWSLLAPWMNAITGLITWCLIPFIYYIWYIVEFIIRYIRYYSKAELEPTIGPSNIWNKAYKNICFEQEAYLYDEEYWYTKQVKSIFAWVKYIKRTSF